MLRVHGLNMAVQRRGPNPGKVGHPFLELACIERNVQALLQHVGGLVVSGCAQATTHWSLDRAAT